MTDGDMPPENLTKERNTPVVRQNSIMRKEILGNERRRQWAESQKRKS